MKTLFIKSLLTLSISITILTQVEAQSLDLKKTPSIGNVSSISLYALTAEASDETVLINWVTATEVNNKSFCIEKSVDAIHWQVIGEVKGANNSDLYLTYNYTDSLPFNGLQYYRLKQIDNDGILFYSEIIVANFEPMIKMIVYPNPAINGFTVCIEEQKSNTTIRVINSSGQIEMEVVNFIGDKCNFNISGQDDGVYFVEINQSGNISRTRLLIQSK